MRENFSRRTKVLMKGGKKTNLGVEVETHDTTGSLAEELRVGGVLQGEDADHAGLCLLVEIICNQ